MIDHSKNKVKLFMVYKRTEALEICLWQTK